MNYYNWPVVLMEWRVNLFGKIEEITLWVYLEGSATKVLTESNCLNWWPDVQVGLPEDSGQMETNQSIQF